MAQCTSCGAETTYLAGTVECVQKESYELNQPNGRRLDVIGRTVWDIALCRTCAVKGLEEAVRFWRRFGLLVGPGLLVAGVVLGLMLFQFLHLMEIRDPVVSMLGLGMVALTLLAGLVMTPMGLIQAVRATGRLKRILQQGDTYRFDDEDRWDSLCHEGERIVKCLEKQQNDFHGGFTLPQGKARNLGMGDSLVYYVIEEKKA